MICTNPVYKNYYHNQKQKENKIKPSGACHYRLDMEVIIEQTWGVNARIEFPTL